MSVNYTFEVTFHKAVLTEEEDPEPGVVQFFDWSHTYGSAISETSGYKGWAGACSTT